MRQNLKTLHRININNSTKEIIHERFRIYYRNKQKWQAKHDSIRSETNILNQHLEEVRSLHLATEKRIVEMDDAKIIADLKAEVVEDAITNIMEQANILMVNDAQAKLRIASIETIQKDLIDKFSNLEPADDYLQKSNRMLTESFKGRDPHKFNDMIRSLSEKVHTIESSFMAVLTDMKDVQRINSKKLKELQNLPNIEVLEIHGKQLKDVQFLLTHQESQLQNRFSSIQQLIDNLDNKIQMMESQKLNTSDFIIFKNTNREGLLNCKNNLTDIDIKNESLNEALVKIREKIQALEERVSKETHSSKFIKIEDFDTLAKILSDKYKTLEMYLKDIASHSNLLREHTENINTFISTNATFNSQILGLESKSEDFLKYLQVERQRIDNVESELNTLDETVKKAQPEIRRNSERLDDLEAHQINNVKNLDDIQPSPRQCKGDSFSQTNDGQPEQQSRRYRGQIEAE